VNTAFVEIDDLTKTYRGQERPALDGLSLAIRAGSFFGLLGPNGAGKSTLISTLCGLHAPTRGAVRVAGHNVRSDPATVKSRIGLVPQDLALYPALSARENLEFFGRMHGLRGARLRARIDACLAIAHLETVADSRAEIFSGGLKRRLNLVIGLIHEPQLLILDEPTVGIDPQSRRFIHDGLRALHAAGMTLIYSTHYMEEAEQLCDDIAIIDHGRILARGSLAELLRGHHHNVLEIRLEQELEGRLHEAFRQLAGVTRADFGPARIALHSDDPAVTLPVLLDLLQREHVRPAALSYGTSNLEQLFLSLTGTRLRD